MWLTPLDLNEATSFEIGRSGELAAYTGTFKRRLLIEWSRLLIEFERSRIEAHSETAIMHRSMTLKKFAGAAVADNAANWERMGV
jgi:hypothetical protein